MKSLVFKSCNELETEELGADLGRLLTSSMVLLLSGDLGAGKTCFTRGLARGLDVPPGDPVTSPSYTLMNQYRGRFDLYHFDLYRLSHPDDLYDLGFEEYINGEGIKVVEWANRFEELESEDLLVELEHSGEVERVITLKAQGAETEKLLERLAAVQEKRRLEP